MLKIGDFSKLSRISIRMLRYYDDDIIGLYQGSPKTKGFAGIVLFFNPEKGIYRQTGGNTASFLKYILLDTPPSMGMLTILSFYKKYYKSI